MPLRPDIRSALADLGRRLTADGVEAGIRVVGGAAIALEYDTSRDRTRDVDAFVHPFDDVSACDVRDFGHAVTIFDRYYPEEELKPRAVREIEAWLGAEGDTAS